MPYFLMLFFLIAFLPASSQTRDKNNWVDFGSEHTNKWLQIAPAKLGPNALPVPEMDYALTKPKSSIETGVQSHFMKGDTAINSYMSFEWNIIQDKVTLKLWGFPSETFHMTNKIRDERQIYNDDTGWITQQGDLWISTFIQVVKDKKIIPDIVINYSFKTTTGLSNHGRYADASTDYFYAAFGKSFYLKNKWINEIRIAGMAGFYVWQTNKSQMAQDEGPLIETGISLRRKNVILKNEIGGYSGYDAYYNIGIYGNNDPVVYRLKLLKTGKVLNWKLEYQTGIHDYQYNTFKFSTTFLL